jgi:uncharacterized caspase-like protein
VIVDACQAEAIFNIVANREAARRSSRRFLDNLSRRARTSYILATRKGERAAENSRLEHGLLTYALLRGLGAPDLSQPAGLGLDGIPPNADLDGDGWIQADELRRYAGKVVPMLAEHFQGQGRGIPTQSIPEPPASIAADIDDEGGAFRLVETPAARPKTGASRPIHNPPQPSPSP